MIQLLSMMLRAAASPWPAGGEPCEDEERWRLDPLSHPALRAMSPAQLGDLPFGRSCPSPPVGAPQAPSAQLAPSRPAPRSARTSLSAMSAG